RGKEALGKVKVSASYKGMTYYANASDTDVIRASGLAYINVINKIIIENLEPAATAQKNKNTFLKELDCFFIQQSSLTLFISQKYICFTIGVKVINNQVMLEK